MNEGALTKLLITSLHHFFFFFFTSGELEWMCIICGFDNKPRSAHCTMCGTEHTFSQDYKVRKIEEKRERKIRHKQYKEAKLQQQEQRRLLSQEEDNAADRLLAPPSTPQKNKRRDADFVDIPIPEEAQITSISMSLKYGNTAAAAQSMSMNGQLRSYALTLFYSYFALSVTAFVRHATERQCKPPPSPDTSSRRAVPRPSQRSN